MSLRDTRRNIPAGTTAKLVHNQATTFHIKETTVPIPILRIDYESNQRSGSAIFRNVKQGDTYRAPDGATFSQIEITNEGLLDIDLLITIGQGQYQQNEISGAVNIQGGQIDTIVNPVTVIPSADKENCFPIQNCEDADGNLEPIVVMDVGASGNTALNGLGTLDVDPNVLPFPATVAIAPNPDRVELYLTNSIDSLSAVTVGASNSVSPEGQYLSPSETLTIKGNGAVNIFNQFSNSATIYVVELVNV